MSDAKLKDLDTTLAGVENALMKRALDRRDATIDDAVDIINQAASDGAIDLDDCDGCEDGEDSAGDLAPEDGEGVDDGSDGDDGSDDKGEDPGEDETD